MGDWFASNVKCREYIGVFVGRRASCVPNAAELWEMSRGRLRCRACGLETTLAAGTVFQDTRKPLRVWFLAVWFVTSQKNGVSSLGLQRVLGLGSYETAWTWLHKLRRAMVRPGRDRLTGAVEVDEIYIGGREKGARGRETGTKSIVVAAVERTVAASAASVSGASTTFPPPACFLS